VVPAQEAASVVRSTCSWHIQTGATWHRVGHEGETGYLRISHRNLPGERFLIRAPEYANLYQSLLLIPAQWTWIDTTSVRMTWSAPTAVRSRHQVDRTAVYRFGQDTIDIVATVRNPTDTDWNHARYDMFDVMTRESPAFRNDPAGRRTYVYRLGKFCPVGGFPIQNLQQRLVGSLTLAKDVSRPGALEITERLMAKVSRDGQWVLGIASDNASGISFNLNPETGCIHQNPFWGRLKAGEQRRTRLRVYLIRGTLGDLWSRYQRDFPANGSTSSDGKDQRP